MNYIDSTERAARCSKLWRGVFHRHGGKRSGGLSFSGPPNWWCSYFPVKTTRNTTHPHVHVFLSTKTKGTNSKRRATPLFFPRVFRASGTVNRTGHLLPLEPPGRTSRGVEPPREGAAAPALQARGLGFKRAPRSPRGRLL